MKNVRFKKVLSILMGIAMTVTTLPSTMMKVNATEETPTIIYSNDFENSIKLPKNKTAEDVFSNINGSKALGYDFTFDTTSNWDQKDIEINTEYTETINSGVKLSLDILLPKDSTFNGLLNLKAATQIGQGWTWTEADSMKPIALDKFIIVGDYKLQTIEFTFGDKIAAEKGLHSIFFQVVGNGCDYNGKVYIDNIKFVEDNIVTPDGKIIYSNDFQDSTKLPKGKTEAELFSNINNSTALRYDYLFDKNNSWDQRDIEINTEYTDPIATGAKLSLDILLPIDSTFTGKVSLKAATQMGASWAWTEADAMRSLDLDKFTIVGDYKLQTVEFTFSDQIAVEKGLHGIFLQVVGNNCDYNGKLYIDNIKLIEGNGVIPNEKYVLKTVDATTQTKVEPSKLSVPSSVSLVDAKAIGKVANLYSYLRGVGESDYVIFGHQNDTHSKAGSKKLSNSDTKDMTGSISGIVAIDSLSLTGAELNLPAGDPRDLVTASADLCADAASEGAIISLSSHMPNFEQVAKKGKVNGKWDYTGYTPNVTTGNVVQRIMPGGDLNEVFLGYMNMIADFGNKLEVKGVPVLYRPFHENSGSWFWWGAAHCDQAAFKDLWKYTVEYLRDVRNVHNFMYVYSPGGPVETEVNYLDRYPGDDYVDVMAFDMYNNDPTATDNFSAILAESMKVIDGLAAKHNKVSAVSETGMIVANENGMKISGNKNINWFEEILNSVAKTNASYFLTWANFGEGSGIFEPYMVDETHGHEMINSFINFYNDEKSIFADGLGDYSNIGVVNTKSTTNTTGYITTPYSGFKVIKPNTLNAIVKNTNKEVAFVLKDSKGSVITTLNATANGSDYSAQITAEILKNINPTYGSIELIVGGELYDTIKAMYNVKEVPVDPSMADDFEYYYGSDELLATQWSPNAGAGCSVTPMTTNKTGEHNKGDYGVTFKYKISTEKISEGWAGITKAVQGDWTSCDALQLWAKPDGYGQKLVIQMTSNGEDFEVHLPEFAATREAKLLTIPFSQFVGKQKGKFDPSKVTKVGIWCNTIIPQGESGIAVDSTMYFDDIKAVNTKVASDNQDLVSKMEVNKGAQVVFTPQTDLISIDAFKLSKQNNKIIVVSKEDVSFIFDDPAVVDTMVNSGLSSIEMEVKEFNNDIFKDWIKKNNANLLGGYSFRNNLPDSKFGGNVRINVNVDKSYSGKKVYFYNVDNNNKFSLINSAIVSADGSATFTVTHFSDYVVVDKELVINSENVPWTENSGSIGTNIIQTSDAKLKNDESIPKTGSSLDEEILFQLGALMFLSGVILIVLIRRKKEYTN